MKQKLKDIHGRKYPGHIVLRINKRILTHIPDNFYMDLSIDDVRDVRKNETNN